MLHCKNQYSNPNTDEVNVALASANRRSVLRGVALAPILCALALLAVGGSRSAEAQVSVSALPFSGDSLRATQAADLNTPEDEAEAELLPPLLRRFWVVNFGTAMTLPKGKVGFAAGMGGQVVFLGSPREPSAFFTIPHAGFRYGVGARTDVGLRLAPVPLPFSTVGPGFGVNLDAKYWFTDQERRIQSSVVLGLGGAHVLIEGKNRFAYSPNAALLGTVRLSDRTDFTTMARAVHLAIPTATGGASTNFVNIFGTSFGWRRTLTPTISLLPEVGAYWYDGQIGGVYKKGPGFQYGIMLATSF